MRLALYCVVALTTWVVLVLGGEEFKAPEGKSLYRHTEYHKKGKTCYQCAWSPPKLAYATLKTSNYQSQVSGYGRPSHTGLYYNTKKVPVKVQGGWDKCHDTFTKNQAATYGIDQWECEHNCYTRTDKNGNIYRGCYKGEYNVNPHKLGCHVQAGSQYCFCAGELCNNRETPEFKGHTKSPAYTSKRSYKKDYTTHDYDFKHKGYGKPESYDRKWFSKYDENSEYDKYDKHDKYDLHGNRYDKKYGYDESDKYEKNFGLDKKHRYDSYGKADSKDRDYGYDYNKKHSKRSYNGIHDKYDTDKHDNHRSADNGYDRRDSHRRGYDRHSSKYGYNKHDSGRYGYGRHDSLEHDYDKHDSHKHDYNKHDSHKHDYDKHDSHKHDYDKHDSHKHDYDKHDSHKHDYGKHDSHKHDYDKHDSHRQHYDKHDSHRQHYDKHDSHEYGSGKDGKHSYDKHDQHGYGRPDKHQYGSHGSHITKYPWKTININKHSSYNTPSKHGYKHKTRGSRRRSRTYNKYSKHDQDYSQSSYGHHKHSTKKPIHTVYPKHGYEKHQPQRYPAAPHHDNHHYRGGRGHH